MDVMVVRVLPIILAPHTRRVGLFLAGHDLPVRNCIFNAGVLIDAQHFGDLVAVATVFRIVGDIQRLHDAVTIGVVIRLAGTMSFVTQHSIVALEAVRPERIDLMPKRHQRRRVGWLTWYDLFLDSPPLNHLIDPLSLSLGS